MCGIAGCVFPSEAPTSARALVGLMCDSLAHRGPDAADVVVRGPAALGHRRLAVIDLSPLAAQPMSTPDGRFTIVFNGEIYNFHDLRRLVESRGHRLRSQSDTEVLLYLIADEGEAALPRLRGMFALAVWDMAKQALLLARDRLGKKPLYYCRRGDTLSFGSEIQGLLADPAIPRVPDPRAIHDYLTYGYVPAPSTGFQGICKLPPAHWLRYSEGRVEIGRYWYLRRRPILHLNEAEAAEETVHRLREAVKLRLVSDVPLGAFLSGGVDSSLVVSLMAEAGAVKTFSIGFDDPNYDERHHAARVAAALGTDHHEFVVRPDALAVIDTLARHYGEPFADSSAIPTYYLAQVTRRHVTVALTGDGGDENFAGYERYAAANLARVLDGVPRPLKRLAHAAVDSLNRQPAKRGLLHRADRFLEALDLPPERRYASWVTVFSNEQKAALYTPEFAALQTRDAIDHLLEAYADCDADDFVERTVHADLLTYLPGDLLPKVDVATMAHSLEARSPLLDHEFVEFCARLPRRMKLRGYVTKYLLKRIARQRLPISTVNRPKQGFGVPIDAWLRGPLKEFAHECLLSARALQRGYFERAAVARLLDRHNRGHERWHHLIWSLVMLEVWHRNMVDGVPSRQDGRIDACVAG